MTNRFSCLVFALFTASAAPFPQPSDPAISSGEAAAFALGLCTGRAPAKGEAFDPQRQMAMARLAFWQSEKEPVLYDNLGDYTYKITTVEPLAQRFFDQGLRLVYAFNHGEAVRAFRKAQRLDPQCALCFWGEALALGPNINAPMMSENVALAIGALDKAKALAAAATPAEQALIKALAARYAADPAADRKTLDIAYAQAMGEAAKTFPKDLDIQTLYAEAIMDVQPWDYWQEGGKKPKGTSGQALKTLERVLKENPAHPGAIHYYIHMVEASDRPERATPYAERLEALMPGAGHMVHMPSHIWYRIGRYKDSLDSNVRAVKADEAYLKEAADNPVYASLYYPHNVHFVAVSAHIQGDAATALEFSKKLAKVVPNAALALTPLAHPVRAAPYFIMADMASPEVMLAEPAPDERFPYVVGMWHFGRGVAFVRANRLAEARREAAAIEKLIVSADFSPLAAAAIPGATLLGIAADVLNARIARASGDSDSAIALLTAAAEKQDSVPYMEPPYWYYPVRQSLGAALLEAGNTKEAIAAFRQALVEAPNNAYALYGLARAYDAAGNKKAAKAAQAQFEKAWAGGNSRPRLEQL